MFNNIAPGYDSLNHKMSFRTDWIWRKAAIRQIQKSGRSVRNILDVGTGTADLALMAAKMLKPESVIGIDISDGMMEIGRRKIEEAGLNDVITLRNEDCSHLPFADGEFDAIISAFVLRNFENIQVCLTEIHRVLSNDGIVAIVDIAEPNRFPMKQLYRIYKAVFMPLFSGRIIKDRKAAKYLDHSMEAVPVGKDMARIFREAGFKDVKYYSKTFGLCYLYVGKRGEG